MGAEDLDSFSTYLHILCGDFRPRSHSYMHRRHRHPNPAESGERLGMDDGLQSRIIDIPCARTLFQLNHLGHTAGVHFKMDPDRFAAGCAADGADLPTQFRLIKSLTCFQWAFDSPGGGSGSVFLGDGRIHGEDLLRRLLLYNRGVSLRTLGHRSRLNFSLGVVAGGGSPG